MTSRSNHKVKVYAGQDSGYLPHLNVGKLDAVMDNVEMALRDKLDEFDSVLVQGISGIVPGAIFCWRHGKNLVVLRKNEYSHGAWMEGHLTERFVILDDFMARGRTVERLLQAGELAGKGCPKYLVLYSVADGRLGYNRLDEYDITRTQEEADKALCCFRVRKLTDAEMKTMYRRRGEFRSFDIDNTAR